MKQSNFSRLMARYITRKTSKNETAKIESMFNAQDGKPIHWMSAETEELLYKKIRDNKVPVAEVVRLMKTLTILRVHEVQWMKFKGMEIYFSKEAY